MSWQLRKSDRHPDLIVRAKTIGDVVNAIKFADNKRLKIGIHSGGHSWVHSSVRDGGMLLDLGLFRDVNIDTTNRTAVIGPAISSRELAMALEKTGLAFPVAHCSTVAMGGYLLGIAEIE